MKNRHSIRLKWFDYTSNGAYFVTICTQNREYLFGDVVNRKMETNTMGNLVVSIWESLPDRFPVIIDTYQIMPNHFHGIIIIDNSVGAPLVGALDLGRVQDPPLRKITLGNIIAYFKYQSTKQINNVGVGYSDPNNIGRENNNIRRENPAPTEYQKIFQRNYYEHIIRNEKDLNKISQYIMDNPLMWERDRNNPENIYV